jgi:ribosomal protein S6--L-glutamate ligase
MLRLGVATDAETFERMQAPLAERDIAVVFVATEERTVDLRAGAEPFPSVDVGFVFPPRLAEGGVADALLDVPWVNGREAILRSRHKAETLGRLRQAGVPTPETVVVSDPVDEAALEAAFDGIAGEVVIKPNATTRGVGVARAPDLDSFLGVCDYLDLVHDYRATGDQSFLVQRFLPDASDYRAMVLDGDYVGAVERRLPDEALAAGRWKHNVHRGAAAEGVTLDPALQTLAEDAAAALDVRLLGVDLLVTDDRAVVNETNARPTIDDETKYDPGFWDRLVALIRRVADEG